MTNNASPAPLRARYLLARRNRQLERVHRAQERLVAAKQELSRRSVAVLAVARSHDLRMSYGDGPWHIIGPRR